MIFTLAYWGISSRPLPIRFCARPFGMYTSSFYFRTVEEFNLQALRVTNEWGGPVEFEIQFIDGNDLDGDLFKTLCINQSNLDKFLVATNTWSKDEKTKALIYARECGKSFEDVAGFIATCRELDWEIMQYRIAEMQEFYP